MDRYIWSVRNKQEDIARAVIDNDGAWAAMAAHEIVMRASHATAAWQDLRARGLKGPDRVGELLADIPRLGEEISRAYKAAKPEDLATVSAELDALVTELEAAWMEVAPSTSRD